MLTALSEARTNIQKILDFSLDVICTIDSQDRFVTVSSASKEAWGYDASELIGINCINIVFNEDRESTALSIAQLKEDPSKVYCENRIVKKDGSLANTAWSAYWHEEDEMLYCVARVIDKQKKIAHLLVESEEQLLFAQRLAKMGNWYIESHTHEVKWSQSLYEVYGIDKNLYPHPTLEFFFSLVHQDDLPSTYQSFEMLKQTGMAEHVHRFTRPDGKTIYLRHLARVIKNEQGAVTAYSGVVQDITEQKETEINLSISEEKFKSLVQNGSDIIAVLGEQGLFKYVSPTSLKIAGYQPEELVGQSAFELIHPEDINYVLDKLQEVMIEKNDRIPTEFRFISKSGEWIWLEALGINRNETNIGGIVINARDITERKKLQEQLAEEQQKHQRAITSAVIKAQESERSQLGQELHDNVNQVLTTVKLYNEMLFDGLGDPKDILQKSIHHLQSCINEIRSISKRLSAPTLGKITLGESINELVESINLTKRLQITSVITGLEQKIIPQDFHLTIYRIVQEQLNNIIKYAEAKNVSIIIRNTPHEFFLQIEDDGKGFNIKAKRKGIGITNMETRAENMNGKLKIISSPGKGCKLIAQFPPTCDPS